MIKKDALWKPLVRKLRKWLKTRVIRDPVYRSLEQGDYLSLGRRIAEILCVPAEIMDDKRAQLALYTIVES